MEFKNRHEVGMPTTECTIEIIYDDFDGRHFHTCTWTPFNPGEYTDDDMPVPGYLGTANVMTGSYTGIGFHAWEQNDSEFIWYKELM